MQKGEVARPRVRRVSNAHVGPISTEFLSAGCENDTASGDIFQSAAMKQRRSLQFDSEDHLGMRRDSSPTVSRGGILEDGLSTKALQTLRTTARQPRESRIWGISEVKGAEWLGTAEQYKRFDRVSLRKLCFAAEIRTIRKGYALCLQGKQQTEVMLIVGGAASVRVKAVDEVTGTWSRETEVPGHLQTDVLGDEVSTVHAGDTIGFWALVTKWGNWSASYVATSKVEVICFSRRECEPLLQSLSRTFDWSTPLQMLHPEHSAQPTDKAADDPRHKTDSVHPEERPETFDHDLAENLRGIPFFRQFEADAVMAMVPSMEVVEVRDRTVLWEQDTQARDMTGTEAQSPGHVASHLHIIMKGTVRVFRRAVSGLEGHLTQRLSSHQQDIKVLWDRPSELLTTFGPCRFCLFPGDTFGGSSLSNDVSIIADGDTQLIRIRNFALALEGVSIVYQQESLRRLLTIPALERTPPQRQRLQHMLEQGLEFFRHVATAHASRLIEQASLRRFSRGDAIIQQGQPATRVFILLNGIAAQYRLGRGRVPQWVWQRWEAFRLRGDCSELGERQRVVQVGRSIGEQEVVEQDRYRSTVVAHDEVEVLEISYETYHKVLWDLCDGQAIPIDLVRRTLDRAPDDRDKQDVDTVIRLLAESDFLTQFSQEMRRRLSRAMHVSDLAPNTVIVQQGRTGHQLFLCISGSVALHKLESKTGPADAEGVSGTSSVVEQYGSCTRVLGIGDSFGELAFVQGRTHPTTALTRTHCTLVCLDREQLDGPTLQRIQSFVSSPRKDVIDGVFQKPLADRNENDVMLLVNYMELNPFMKPFSYAVMIDCAHTMGRQVGSSGHAFGEDGEVSERQVCIVNRGSMLATPKHPGAQIAIKNEEDSSQTLLQKLHSYRFRYREKNDEYVFFGFLSQCSEASAATISRGPAPTARFSRTVFAIDTNGDLTYTESIETGTLTELGHVSEIHTLERMSLPRFQFALLLGVRGDHHLLAANFRSESDAFIHAVCLFHPYFHQRFAQNAVAFAGPLSLCLSADPTPASHSLEWKMLHFRLDGDGELSYSASQNPDDEAHWHVVGKARDLLSCVATTLKDKHWAMELVFNPCRQRSADDSGGDDEEGDAAAGRSASRSRLVLAALSKSERDTWLDQLGLKGSKSALETRFGGSYGQDKPELDQAVVLVRRLLLHVVLRKRARRARAYQHLARAATSNNRSPSPPRSRIPASFVGYGSACSFAGRAVANEDCELFVLTRGHWDGLKKRAVGQQLDELVALLGELPALQSATPRELTSLAANALQSTHFAGEVLACDGLSGRHVHVIQHGECILRRARRGKSSAGRRGTPRSKPQGPAQERRGEGEAAEECPSCGGQGLRSGVVKSNSLLERVDLCPACNGTGEVPLPEGSFLRRLQGQVTDIAVLRRLALVHEAVAEGEQLGLYELAGQTRFAVLSLRKEQWDDIQGKRQRAGIAGPEPQAGWLAQQQILNAQSVMEGMRRGQVALQQERSFAMALSLEQRALMAAAKEHSRRAKAITVLLGGVAAKAADDKRFLVPRVADRRDATPRHCPLAPPATVANPFRHGLPPVDHPPVNETEVKAALVDGLLSTASRPPLKLTPGLSPMTPRRPDTVATAKDRGLMHMLTPRREVSSEAVGFHRPHKLKYGNQFGLDPRQQRVFAKISTLLAAENFGKYSTIHNFDDAVMPTPSVNMFEWFEALKSFDLLRSRATDNAVYELRAVSKADAMRIYWKAVHELGGEVHGGARLGMDAFHVAVRDVCRLLQTPLDGKPDGKATVARKLQGQGENRDFEQNLGLKKGAAKAWLSPMKPRDQAREEAEKLAQMESYALRYLAVGKNSSRPIK